MLLLLDTRPTPSPTSALFAPGSYVAALVATPTTRAAAVTLTGRSVGGLTAHVSVTASGPRAR